MSENYVSVIIIKTIISASGAEKTGFSRFVSWMNGTSTFQIKVHKDYTEDFGMDLREVSIQSGESNIFGTHF